MDRVFTFLIHLILGRLAERVWRRDMLLSPGTVLRNRYVISKVHEQGRENAVYLAYDKSQDLDLAIKENAFDDPAHRREFELEAAILAQLRHPNIPRALDYFIEDHYQFIVMDYIKGMNLQQVMQRRPPATEEILGWAVQLCDILSDLHSLRPPVIHSDVEPSNIILNAEGQLFLVDFGFARVGWPESEAVRSGSPEMEHRQGKDQQNVRPRFPKVTDQRIDQYCLAATLYALLMGAPRPYSREYLSGEPELPRIRPVRPDLSPSVEEAIFRALSLDPNRRYRFIEDFRSALGV